MRHRCDTGATQLRHRGDFSINCISTSTVDSKIAGSRPAQFKSPDCGPTAMSLPERRFAADGAAYTYYGTHARQLWERAAATEHSESSSIATDALPALQPQAAATRRCSTQADFVQMHDVGLLGTERGRDATEQSPMENTMEPQACSGECIETRTAVQSECVGNRPRDATEHSPWENALPPHAGNTLLVPQDAHEHALVLMPASSTASPQATERLLQCVNCERPLCGTEDLAFFWRANKQGGVEVHLMLKPENKEPATFIRSPVKEKGAMASWQCACGFKFGNTRAVAVQKSPMTAFKSSSVMLCGQRFTGSKSKWPSIYNQYPFNAIEVRTRDTFFGPTTEHTHHDATEHTPHCHRAHSS